MGEGGQTKRDQAKYSCNPRLTRAYLWLHLSVIQLIRACPDPQRSHLKIQSLLPLYQLYLPECFNCISLNVSTVFSSKIQLKIKSLLPQALTVPLLHQGRKFVFGKLWKFRNLNKEMGQREILPLNWYDVLGGDIENNSSKWLTRFWLVIGERQSKGQTRRSHSCGD